MSKIIKAPTPERVSKRTRERVTELERRKPDVPQNLKVLTFTFFLVTGDGPL